MWTRTRLWLASLFKRRQFDRDLADELTFHVQARAEHLRREGVPAGEAERRARLEFGSVEKYKDQARDVRTGLWIEQLRQDLRYGVRILLSRPGFTTASTLTLALGIGATATVFSVLDVVLLRPLPVRHAEELAHIYTSCRAGDVYCASSYPEYLDYRAHSRAFVDMAAFGPASVNVNSDSGSWVASALLVSTNYFSLLGIVPHVGQLLSPGADVSGDPSVVIGHSAWLTRFGGDPTIIGRTLRLSGSPFRVVGVAPPEFQGTRLGVRPDLWIPIENVSLIPAGAGRDMLVARDTRWIAGTVGRLRTGTTVAQAQADMRLISDGLQASDPSRAGRFVTVEAATTAALPPSAAGDITRFVALLMGGVSATLLIACANIAGLLLARGAARRRELELRRALGADRGRLVRQLFGEYLPLALAGTVCGIFIARWTMALLSAYSLPGALSVASLDLDLNTRVLIFAAVLLIVTALFGLVSGAWHDTRPVRHDGQSDNRRGNRKPERPGCAARRAGGCYDRAALQRRALHSESSTWSGPRPWAHQPSSRDRGDCASARTLRAGAYAARAGRGHRSSGELARDRYGKRGDIAPADERERVYCPGGRGLFARA